MNTKSNDYQSVFIHLRDLLYLPDRITTDVRNHKYLLSIVIWREREGNWDVHTEENLFGNVTILPYILCDDHEYMRDTLFAERYYQSLFKINFNPNFSLSVITINTKTQGSISKHLSLFRNALMIIVNITALSASWTRGMEFNTLPGRLTHNAR